MKKIILSVIALLTLTVFTPSITANASTGYDYGNSIIREAVTTKTVKVYKVLVGSNESKNKFHYVSDLKIGTKIKTSAWITGMNGYVITTKQYKCSKHHFYFVKVDQSEHWFR